MFAEGKIKSYQQERGFGFIEVENHKKDLFFHIKDIPNNQITPQIGERLKFRIVEEQGKLKADHIVRLDVVIEQSQPKTTKSRSRKPAQKSFNFFGLMIKIAIFAVCLAVIIPFIKGIYHRETLKNHEPIATVSQPLVEKTVPVATQQFKCDGRIHCSQMRSYEEAVFFINNCPGTKMDGDGDGEPCESQFR